MLSKSHVLSFVASATLSCSLVGMLILSGCSPAPTAPPADKPTDASVAPAASEGLPTEPEGPAIEPEKFAVEPAEKSVEPAPPEEPVTEPTKEAAEPAEKIDSNAEGTPEAPKVSTFAPAEDLASQVDKYIKGLTKIVANEEDYNDGKNKIARDSNTLIVIALALGLHDQDSKYKAHAGALMEAAQELAATKDFESAKKAIADVQDAAEGKAEANVELKWGKIASLPELMKQVPLINTKLKRYAKGSKFKSKAKDTAGYTAVIATIAQGSIADASATDNSDEQVKQWRGFCVIMRDHAGAVNAAIHEGDEPAAAEAMKKLAQSCDDCHAVFHVTDTE